MNRLLIVAFHFPPIRQSSGVHRTLNFVRHLRKHGWEAVVLTINPCAYQLVGDELLLEVPESMVVERAFGFDAARHLSIFGRYPKFFANPDRWASWLPFAVRAGKRLIREYQPRVLFSTYPIATAHVIGDRLAQWSGLPWIADFRDSMFDEAYPSDLHQRKIHVQLDERVARRSRAGIVTTPSAQCMYRQRYPTLPPEHWHLIPNGFDEHVFVDLSSALSRREMEGDGILLVHSGILYPVERDPLPFLTALRMLKQQGEFEKVALRVRLRATAHDNCYAPLIRELELEDVVELAPAIAYRNALAEMVSADGLLLFQAAGCNHQVPAKLYEYLRAQRPIIALTDAAGDTAQILREADADNLLPLDNAEEIARGLHLLLERLASGTLKVAPMSLVSRYSREAGVKTLARLLDTIADQA